MLKRKKVYICDHCYSVALQHTYCSCGDMWNGPPDGWTKLGKEDLCPTCSEVYSKFKQEIDNKNNNVHTIGFAVKGE